MKPNALINQRGWGIGSPVYKDMSDQYRIAWSAVHVQNSYASANAW